MRHEGGCHCGAIRVAFETERPITPRACQCSFCRRHLARSVSDPDGLVTVTYSVEAVRYRFGARTADFLICPRCGIYVGATTEIEGAPFAVLNLNAFDEPHPDLEGEPFDYEGESVEARAERRLRRWTPLRLVPGAPA